jgi:hypothetical protein
VGAIEYGIALKRAGETVYAPRMGFFLCVKSRVISTHHIVLHTPDGATLGFRLLHRVVSSGAWSGVVCFDRVYLCRRLPQ